MKPGVFIAMPVYQGSDFIEETLRSILAQTYEDFHLVMSVDGPDDPTVEVCQKYTNDPRIDLVVQDSRLGWPGNLNWLIRRCDREFFGYWQQDDLASTGYLEALLKEFAVRPDAAIAYTDVQWFGARFDRNSSQSIEGDPLSRVMQHIEAIRYEPLRGLMRSSMLPTHEDAVPVTADESCQEEFVFLTHMAARGAFTRIDSAMYFKRMHDTNVFARWARFPDWRRRRGWISMGAGMYDIAKNLAPPQIRPRILAQILDRLAVRRHGRAHFYEPSQTPSELERFVRDFVAYAGIAPEELGQAEGRSRPLERPVHEDILDAIQVERAAGDERAVLWNRLATPGASSVDIEVDGIKSLLGYGWSHPESWGVWTDGEFATLRIPITGDRPWRVQLHGRSFPDSGSVRIGHGWGGGPVVYQKLEHRAPIQLSVDDRYQQSGEPIDLRLHLPDAISPQEAGTSSDERRLGFALTGVRIEVP